MSPLYTYLLIGSVIVPLAYAIFVENFIKDFKKFILSTCIVAFGFLVWDYYFTEWGVWGFNYEYCAGVKLLNMPIEEWGFFFIIPFCSLFIHFALFSLYPKMEVPKKATRFISFGIISISVGLALTHLGHAYTFVNYSVLALVVFLGVLFKPSLLQQFYISFLIILIPFFLVNGALTGYFTPEPVVWYNDLENLGVRIGSVPVEDLGYAFSMLFGNVFIYEALQKK